MEHFKIAKQTENRAEHPGRKGRRPDPGEKKSRDEIGQLAQAVNKFIANLHSIMMQISQSADKSSETSRQYI
ncbi:MAG: HAMP domain-containing protein [Peptococcaceae bacterium]|nr:HAMP domain-containing protein [Peptococcaceae bacterium]